MPHRHRIALVTLVGALLLAFGAGPASALTTSAGAPQYCKWRHTRQAFAAFGDAGDYFLAPRGSFEYGLAGWGSDGAEIAYENEPWYVRSAWDDQSVQIVEGSVLASTPFCFRAHENSVRLFVKRPGEVGASLDVVLTVTRADGAQQSVVFPIDGSLEAGWTPTDSLPIPEFGWSGDLYLTISFAVHGPGAWLVDDVFVDPLKCC